MKYKFYDTCSLLKALDHIWEDDSRVVISSITLQELENIKTSNAKDPETKFAARRVVNELDSRFGQYDVFIWNNSNARSNTINDNKILLSVLEFQKALNEDDELIFVTNDICCKHLARAMFTDIKIVSFSEEIYDYDGYKEVYLDMDGMNEFYSNQDINLYNLLVNQYLLIYDKETRECVDRLCWCKQDGVEGYRRVNFVNFNSHWFGDVKPMKGDDYQMLAADSLTHNKISMIKGKAGTGKTFLSLAYLLHKLERHQIDRIIVFCNTVATKNSAKLGYYPGTRDEKLLDSQIGNLLSSKFGGKIAVEQMIQQEQLVLLPLSDIRGYDTSGMRAGIYISEAQNLDIDLMKLTLQRIGEDSVCIIDGDCKTQVDDINFAGSNNGMRRVSEVFRGEDVYGEVTLKNIHRSRIAEIAENL